MIKTPHTINSRFYGCFYELPSGRTLYLAHRTPGQVYRAKTAWCLDESTLSKCRALGISSVGVVVRRGKKPLFYLTHIDDFYDPAKSFSHFGDSPQRGLPTKWFRIHPGNSSAALSRITAIGR